MQDFLASLMHADLYDTTPFAMKKRPPSFFSHLQNIIAPFDYIYNTYSFCYLLNSK